MFMDPAEPVGFMFSPIFARGTGDQTSEPQHKLESKITPPVSWHGHGRSSSFMENTIKIGGCSIAMLVYRSVGIFGISTKQKNTSKWNAKSPSRLQLFGHESRFSSIEGTYITSITEQNYMWCSCFKKSWGHCSNSSSSQSIVDNARQLSIKRNKKLFHGLCRLCMEPLQHPFFNVFIAQVTVHRYNFWTLWKAWPSSPSLVTSRQRGNKSERGMTWQLVIKSDDTYSKKSSNKCLGEGLTGKTSLLVTFTKKCPDIFDSKHASWGPLKAIVRVRPFGNSQTPTDETWWNGSWDPFTISIGKTFQENSKGSFLADDLSMCKGVFYQYILISAIDTILQSFIYFLKRLNQLPKLLLYSMHCGRV